MGLIGSHGILPLANYFQSLKAEIPTGAWWRVPSLLWLDSSDGVIRIVWLLGVILAGISIFAIRPKVVLAGCLLLWLSICNAGQDFLSFQWDILLVETGFLALFADRSPIRVWLFRWLIFRLMFFSGCVKLLSHDRTWSGLTAMSYHYETQPLPTPVAWYLHQLPMSFQKVSTAFVFVIELGVPLLFFAPRRLRQLAAWATIALQLLIIATGNYTFFNILAIALTGWLFIEITPAPDSRLHRTTSILLATFILTVSGLLCLGSFVQIPEIGGEIVAAVEPFHLVSSYGLFAQMTTIRNEIVIEGSNDGDNWLAYEFPYKPGDPLRAPTFVAPYQPRLDWQMWFAALGTARQNPWFESFILRLLQGEPSVLRLMKSNPFPSAPPKYIRARLYLYHFTHLGEKGWWTREERGLYFPAVSLK